MNLRSPRGSCALAADFSAGLAALSAAAGRVPLF
jgi:hypothetical protein